MKLTLRTLIGTSAVSSLLAFAVAAQVTHRPNSGQPADRHARQQGDSTYHTDRPGPGDHGPQAGQAGRIQSAAKASDIIGMKVQNRQGERIGAVNDLAVDVESGRIVQVILSSGGFMGIGKRLNAVPPGALRHDATQAILHLDASQEQWRSAPAFAMSAWAENANVENLSALYGHYGQEPAWGFVENGDPTREAPRSAERGRPEDPSSIPASRLGLLQKATDLLGMAVENRHSESLGNVTDLVVDLPAGRVLAVIISAGGFLGLGDELSAIPSAALGFTAAQPHILQLDASRESLSSAPHFNANQWPDFAEADYAGSVYQAFQVEPYFTADAADRSAGNRTNAREGEAGAETTADQGNRKADADTTAQIRKAVDASENLSPSGRNVNITTRDGRVTLRGTVDSAEEKQVIGEIAHRLTRDGRVDNQLEVTLATTSSIN